MPHLVHRVLLSGGDLDGLKATVPLFADEFASFRGQAVEGNPYEIRIHVYRKSIPERRVKGRLVLEPHSENSLHITPAPTE